MTDEPNRPLAHFTIHKDGRVEQHHECGYPEDSFPCRIRHLHLQHGWARDDH